METSERNIEANMNELIGRIEAKYEKMSKGQKRLAEYVKENYDKAVFLTAARLGEIVGVSESTVVRFATQLGYRGYPEFQKALEELPETAMTKYMKLVIYIREKKLYEWSYDNALDFDEACKKLEEIVKLDEKYYKIAVNDGEISKEFMEYYDQGDWKLY